MASTGAVFDPSKLNMPVCIWLQFGTLKVASVLSTGCWLTLMSRDFYDKLRRISSSPNPITCEIDKDGVKVYDGCGGATEILKEVHLHISIEGEKVPIRVNVVRKLVTDIVLGGEFIGGVNGVFHYGLGAFKWQFNTKTIVSDFITDPKLLNVYNDSKGTKNESKSNSERPRVENYSASMELHDDSSDKKPPSSGDNKKDDKEKQKDDYIDYLEAKVAHEISQTTASVSNWKNVYVMTKELIGILGLHSMGYNGIFWGKGSKFNVVFGTSLEGIHVENFHLIAISKIIQTAKDNNWKCLRIFSNNEFVTKVFNYALCSGVRKIPTEKDLEFLDFRAFRYVLNNVDRVNPVVFEYVPNITEVSEMRKLERLVDLYITNH